MHDAELHNWGKAGNRYFGEIYNDTKGRFEDGTSVNTSSAVAVEGDILVTKNTRYKLVNQHGSQPKQQLKGRLSLEELDAKLRTAANMIGIADVDTSGRGRSFMHTKTGDHYIAVAVGLKESDLSVEVVYHPLRMPSVRWHRPLKDFTEAFRPVVEPG